MLNNIGNIILLYSNNIIVLDHENVVIQIFKWFIQNITYAYIYI